MLFLALATSTPLRLPAHPTANQQYQYKEQVSFISCIIKENTAQLSKLQQLQQLFKEQGTTTVYFSAGSDLKQQKAIEQELNSEVTSSCTS